MLILVTPATEQPVTLSAVKSHLGIVDSYSNVRLQNYINAAINFIEFETNLALCSQTWTEKYADFPNKTMKGPIQSITSLQYYDDDNTLQTLVENTDFYATFPYKQPAVIEPAVNNWPSVYCRPDAVQLTYVAGWDFVNGVWLGPDMVGHAINILVTYWNDGNRGSNSLEIPSGFDRILANISYGWYE